MGPGMFDDMVKGLLVLGVAIIFASAACGACGYHLWTHYDVKFAVEKKP